MSVRFRLVGLFLGVPLLACTAYRLPPAEEAPPDLVLSPASAVIVPLSMPGHVSQPQADEFVARLKEDLLATGLFESVEVGEAAGARQMLVRPEYEARRCFAEPLITVVTLGIVPYPGCYYSGYRLTLSGPPLSRDVVVDNRSAPLPLWGWVAGPIGLLPGWSHRLPVERERQGLRISIQHAIAQAGW